ncbi:MAG: Gfo/Idh/MocA family oxidoreductase, partial [Opitutales bacterium]
KNFDAVTVITPDHMHAPVTMTALQLGKGTYTQKPMTRTIQEARAITEASVKAGVPTQMGNQHHSGLGYRTLFEMVRGGAIGKVASAHAWSNRPIWPQGIDRPSGSDPIPAGFDWDKWLGVAPERPFKLDTYHPFKWRGWFDFGAGALGDMGCHIIDPVVWILGLGPAKSVAYEGPKPKPETFPATEVLTYLFAGTEFTSGDELAMKWYDGGQRPAKKGTHLPMDAEIPSQGAMFIGEEGTALCPHGGMPRLWPTEKFSKLTRPKVERLDHYKVWLDAFHTGEKPNSHFGYAGPLTETVLMGVVAARVGTKKELKWDSTNLHFTNSRKANQFVRPKYRTGWEVEGLG